MLPLRLVETTLLIQPGDQFVYTTQAVQQAAVMLLQRAPDIIWIDMYYERMLLSIMGENEFVLQLYKNYNDLGCTDKILALQCVTNTTLHQVKQIQAIHKMPKH